MRPTLQPIKGFTFLEIMIVLVIIVILGGVFIVSLTGLRAGDHIDRGAQMIFDDLLFIRSRAVSTNQNHRLNFGTTSAWAMEAFNGTAWAVVAQNRQMPTNTFLTTTSRANAATNLEATPRGLFQFNLGATGEPYVVVAGTGTSKTKSINVFLGGALELRSP